MTVKQELQNLIHDADERELFLILVSLQAMNFEKKYLLETEKKEDE